MDKDEYDRPEDESSFASRAMVFLILAIVVIGILYGIFNTDVFS